MSGRSALPTPMVVSDTMEPVQSMLDGLYYDSKRALRSTYRAANVTEVGDDPAFTNPEKMRQKFKNPAKPDRKAIRESLEKAASRVGIPV